MRFCSSYRGQSDIRCKITNVYGASICAPVPQHAFHHNPTRCLAAPVDKPSQQLDEVAVETAVRIGWDPAGILPPIEQVGTTDHFARRAKQKLLQQQQQDQQSHGDGKLISAAEQLPEQAAAAVPPQAYSQAVRPQQAVQQQQHQQHSVQSTPAQLQQHPPQQTSSSYTQAVQEHPVQPASAAAPSTANDPVDRIPAKWLSQGGIPASDSSAYDRQAFIAQLAEKFIPIDLNFPGLCIMNFDPAIFTVEGFMTPEECSSWQQHALESGCLQQSKIGGGNASAAAGNVNVYGSRRTSSSLLLDPQTQAKSPGLTALMQTVQDRGKKLLAHLDGGRSWGATGKMPAGGQYCYESPQVAKYEAGQHFLAHEDGFPALLATANGFQRHATLLLYLNDVQQGGATHFDHLGLLIQPKQGMALLFFPSYANGTADPRTLHTAQDAVDTKWVMQQWIARGYPVPKAVLKAVKVAAVAGPETAGAAAAAQTVREVFRVPVSVTSSSNGSSSSSKKSKKGSSKGGGKKGFSRQ